MLFQVNYLLVLAQEDQVDWKHHSNGVHTLGRHDPETAAKARPALGLSEQTYEAAHVAIRYGCFGRDERLPGLVLYTNCTALVIIRHRPTPRLLIWILVKRLLTRPSSDVAAK